MKNFILELKKKVLNNEEITREEALKLLNLDIDKNIEDFNLLLESADEIRKTFCGDDFDLCTIMNAKSGKCPENCRYCAQSSHFKTASPVYPLVSPEEALKLAKHVEEEGAHKFSLVTSGRGLKDNGEVDQLTEIYKTLKANTNIKLCASHGLLTETAARKLKEAGVLTYHHNLETSRDFYKEICTTHTFQDRVDTVKNAQKAGLKVCSGGIFGLGESPVDRIDMALELRELKVDSVPLNFLTPIPGTPMENFIPVEPKEILKTIAIYRFILPNIYIRYAGGRLQLGELQVLGLKGGINSALTGNFLTTTGSTIASDTKMAKEMGFDVK
ncbi:biotin synthase [Cetobacterium ceti]|uniref:Biotin synthase n=1 Tax=Cetobacterium ceti TaxID=180163 RepID=A0A1T4Q009_9FUSO|nr:biotin synthase BioB [Cetobacterium ceti]SJZ97112.1 biotin synthase [Cetobacterium ceti]